MIKPYMMKKEKFYERPQIRMVHFNASEMVCQSPSGEIEPWTEENVEW